MNRSSHHLKVLNLVRLPAVEDNSRNTPAQPATPPTVHSPVSDHRYASVRISFELWSDFPKKKAHNQCSETFYKKEIETEIDAEPSKNAQERQRMMDLLKKFEEESVADQTLLEDEDDDPSDLVQRFGAVDLGMCLLNLTGRFLHTCLYPIDSTTPDALWDMLTPAERSKFITVFNNPTGELAQQLLASESLEKEIQDPWWEAEDNSQIKEDISPQRHKAKPRIMEVPLSMVNPNPTGHSLMYNICGILYMDNFLTTSSHHWRLNLIDYLASLMRISPATLGYLHCVTFGIQSQKTPKHDDLSRVLYRFLPIVNPRNCIVTLLLFPPRSGRHLTSWVSYPIFAVHMLNATDFILKGVMTNELFSLLLRDSALLLTPLFVTELTTSPGSTTKTETMVRSHPHSMSILALSDLYDMFSNDEDEKRTGHRKGNHVTHKLTFYAAHVLSTSSDVLRTLVQEMIDKAEMIDKELW